MRQPEHKLLILLAIIITAACGPGHDDPSNEPEEVIVIGGDQENENDGADPNGDREVDDSSDNLSDDRNDTFDQQTGAPVLTVDGLHLNELSIRPENRGIMEEDMLPAMQWIELYHGGPEAASLGGLALVAASVEANDGVIAQLPAVQMPRDSFLTIWFVPYDRETDADLDTGVVDDLALSDDLDFSDREGHMFIDIGPQGTDIGGILSINGDEVNPCPAIQITSEVNVRCVLAVRIPLGRQQWRVSSIVIRYQVLVALFDLGVTSLDLSLIEIVGLKCLLQSKDVLCLVVPL